MLQARQTGKRNNVIDAVVGTTLLCGTLPQSATRPLKTYSTAVRAISCSACRQGPLSGNRTRSKKVRTRSNFIQLPVVGDIKCEKRLKPENRKDPLTMTCI